MARSRAMHSVTKKATRGGISNILKVIRGYVLDPHT